jgi:hypothetical protein
MIWHRDSNVGAIRWQAPAVYIAKMPYLCKQKFICPKKTFLSPSQNCLDYLGFITLEASTEEASYSARGPRMATFFLYRANIAM